MKKLLGKIAAAFLVLVSTHSTATHAQSQNLTVLHTFTSSPDGNFPVAGPQIDAAGNLYGTTFGGGPLGGGTLWKLDSASNETVLASGLGEPFAPVVRDTAGNLYGTSRDGGAFGNGTVFKLDSSGHLTVLHSFMCAEGANPFAGVVIDAAGNLYGTTSGASACGVPGGTVFKIDAAGNFKVLHTFTGPDGAGPTGGVILDAAGNLYGTTGGGGTGACPIASFVEPCGTVFKLDPTGNLTVLYSFEGGSDGAGPVASLIMDVAGNLYGTTVAGGFANPICGSQVGVVGCGTVFKLDPSRHETVLYRFTGYPNDGSLPTSGLVMDASGNLYGTTSEGGPGPCTGRNQVVVGCGTVFKLDPAGNETILHSFTGGDDGATPGGTDPGGTLAMDVAGNLYGTAAAGGFGTTAAGGPCTVVGGLGGCGTVFKLTVQVPPNITSISPTGAIAGGPGLTLTVNGTNFVNGSTVNFGGNARATTFVSATQLAAAILVSDITTPGAFNVTVTNPGATTSSAVTFTVVTPQDATQAITSSVNVLFGQGVINGGQDNSLLTQLQHAITLMNAGKNAGAIGNLNSFISEVNDLLASGVLSSSQAASLISVAESVIAAI